MTTALVTGAGGFVGSHLVTRLLKSEWQVKVLARDAARLPEQVASLPLELTNSSADWSRALEGIDVVFHLAGIAHRKADAEEIEQLNVRSPAMLAEASQAAGVGGFVWLSSIKVFGETSMTPFAEDAPYAPADVYAASKVEAEKRLGELAGAGSGRLVIVRPPLIYGVGVKANFLALLSLARLAQRGLPLPLGCATAPRSLLGVKNLCDFLLAAGMRGNGALHVADADDCSVAELLTMMTSGSRIHLWRIPKSTMRTLLSLSGRAGVFDRLFEPLQLDTRRSAGALGWHPPEPTSTLIDETMQWFLQR